jgi:hypothetical protein
MKARSFAKAVAISAASAVIITGLSAAPAMADPAATPPVTATTLVGFGSDTTQDVMNAISCCHAESGGFEALVAMFSAGVDPARAARGAGYR